MVGTAGPIANRRSDAGSRLGSWDGGRMQGTVLRATAFVVLLALAGGPSVARAKDEGRTHLDPVAAPATLTIVVIDEYGGALGGACFALEGTLTSPEVCPTTPATPSPPPAAGRLHRHPNRGAVRLPAGSGPDRHARVRRQRDADLRQRPRSVGRRRRRGRR